RCESPVACPWGVCCAAETTARHRIGLLLEPGEPDSFAFALTGAAVRPGLEPFAEVYGLEDLLAHLVTPGQTRYHRVDCALGADGEDPAGGLGFLPGVERVDQIEPGPRHIYAGTGLAVRERGFHDL